MPVCRQTRIVRLLLGMGHVGRDRSQARWRTSSEWPAGPATPNAGGGRGRVARCRVAAAAVIAVVGVGLTASPRAIHSAAAPDPNRPGARPELCPTGALLPYTNPATFNLIHIATDADWTAANGVTGGSGTATDPYIISCWSITDKNPHAGNGIQVDPPDKAFVVRDVAITGDLNAVERGVDPNGSSIRIEHVTATALGYGILISGNFTGPIVVTSNLLQNNIFLGEQDTNAVYVTVPVVSNNLGLGNAGCIGSTGAVTGNTCRGGGTGISTQPLAANVSGNLVEGMSNWGFKLVGGSFGTGSFPTVNARQNTARGNGIGYILLVNSQTGPPPMVFEQNIAEQNGTAGLDISSAVGTIIRNNTIVNNGSAGILAQPAQVPNGAPAADLDLIDGNHVGGSPFGIVFAFEPTSNTVQNTDWLDGHPSFIRFSNSTTVVDAGSAQNGLVGTPTSFHDWIAQVQAGSVGPNGTDTLGAATGGTFDFGDGSPVHTFTAPDLTNVATLLQHTYTAPGSYTATLTVNATNTTGGAITLTDTAPVTIAASSPSTSLIPPVDTAHWSELGNGPDRSFFQGTTGINKSNVASLHVKWRFPTAYPVFASPAIADVNVPPLTGGPPVLTRMVFDGTYDGNVYGLSDATGLPVWGPVCIVTSSTVSTSEASCNPSFPGNTNAQVDYGTIIGSPAVATIGTSQRVFIAANGTLDALDAATGHVIWSFVGNATGTQFPQQTTCRQISKACEDTTYEMESSPVVVGNVVYVGIDCNGECLKGGGIYALDATDGHMLWFFDPAAGGAFVPSATTTPPSPVMAYNPKMNGPASGSTCGGVWTSPTIDVALGLLYASTANCQTNPLPPYMEAVFALHTADGSPAWQNQPRPIDALDMDFGATPNVFKLGTVDVVGAASKDGTYTLYDATLGTVKWSTKAALGGAFGGFYNSVTDGTKIYLSSAIGNVDGFSVTPAEENQRGRQYALDARTGNVMWRQLAGPFNIGQNSAVPGIYLTGGLDHLLHAWDADTGAPLAVFPLAGAASGTPVVAANEVYIGAGTGATYRSFVGPSDPLGLTGVQFPHPIPIGEYGQGIYAFCLAADLTCPATPAATVPEAPRAVLMPLLGGGILVLAFAAPTLWRRRRARAAH